MPTSPEEFQDLLKTRVHSHYKAFRTPFLLAHLGSEIEKKDDWPTDRGQRNLKQLIIDTCGPDLQIVFDKRSPAYVAVVTSDMRAEVQTQIEARLGIGAIPVRIEEIARPVLLAFCVNVQNQLVYIRRTRPFRYEVGTIPEDRAAEYILVDQEFRRPGLRIDHPHQLSLSDRRDLESGIQKWAAVHGIEIDRFFRLDQEEKEVPDTSKTALDRLVAAQSHDISLRMLIPADIAQILSRIR